jgi:Zn-dependent protease with chaperone function
MSERASERVHFLDDQRRNRRRSFRFAVFAIIAVAFAGLPLCVLIAPLLLGGVLIVARIVDLFAPLGAADWAALHDAVFVGPTVWRKLGGHETAISWRALAVIYVAPGATLMLVAWPFVRLLSRRAGAGSLLHHLPSRPPDPTHMAEQQMVNVVAEMAVAAGITPPSLRVIDSPAVNAVAIGLTVSNATVLVTNGFLDRLDRDERQAMVGHLVGSVGNGDLEIAATILSVFETWGLVAAVLETPLSARRRALVGKLVRLAYDEMRGRANPRDASAVVDALLAGVGPEGEDFITMVEGIQPKAAGDACLIILVKLPLIAVIGLATIAARETANLFTVLVLGRWLAAMWRARRRLADATAVELTRNPTALASAVRTLATCDVEVPGGWPVHFLFPVWVPVTTQSSAEIAHASTFVAGMRLDPEPRLRRLAVLGATLGRPARVRLAARIRGALPDWGELRTAAKWTVLACLVVALLLVVTVLSASLVLIALWYLLHWAALLVGFVRRLIAGGKGRVAYL